MKTVKLQGIYREQKAIPAGELKPGMITIWNFGYREVIKSIEPSKTGKTLKAIIISEETGKEYMRKMNATRLVAIE